MYLYRLQIKWDYKKKTVTLQLYTANKPKSSCQTFHLVEYTGRNNKSVLISTFLELSLCKMREEMIYDNRLSSIFGNVMLPRSITHRTFITHPFLRDWKALKHKQDCCSPDGIQTSHCLSDKGLVFSILTKGNVIFLHPVARSITQSLSSVFVRHFWLFIV
jgi:hypothetical protein